MAEKETSFLKSYVARFLFLIALLCAAFSVLYVAYKIPLENTRLTRTQPVRFEQGWQMETAAGAQALPEPSRPAAHCLHNTLILRNTLPPTLPGGMVLSFQTKNERVRVWVDGELAYTYGETLPLAYGHGVGAVWHLAPLPEGAEGAVVRIELTPVAQRTGLTPYEFLLGTRGDVITCLLQQKMPLLIICVILCLIGVGALGLSLGGYFRRAHWKRAVFFFSIFVLLTALWTATDSGLLQFVSPNKGVSYMLFGCSFYLLSTPFALFLAAMLPEHRKLFNGLSIVNSLYATLRILLYMYGVLDFETGLWLLHLLMGGIVLITNLVLWLPVLRKREMQQRALCLAVTAFTLISSVSLISFYVQDKLNMLRSGYSSGYYVGILCFVLITAADAVRQTQRLREQAFKAEFFERRAYTDELTGLLNVKGFDDKCAALLREAAPGVCYAVVDFDVNYFSQYNATNGLEAGDALLQRIAGIARDTCRSDELCARQEADHFVCMVYGDTLEDILQRLEESAQTARGDMAERKLLLSYGVVEVRDMSLTPAALRNQALVAKRTIKGNYEKTIAVYDRALHELQLQEMALLSGFEAALANGEYIIYLQPKMHLKTGRVGGAEALARHVGPDGAVLSAGPIIEALERKGFVTKLDYDVLEQVCKFLRRCLDEGRTPCPISSNFSRVHLYDSHFPARVAEIVDRYGLPHDLVEIELTETAFLAGKDALHTTVRRLHDHGFSVSIDDFGSGYSSLNMLKDVEVDTVKLDREFLADFTQNRRAGVVIAHTLRLAQEMEITSVAEGIETAEQLAFLRQMGCDLVQGYYCSMPLPETAFIERYLPLKGAEQEDS